MWPPRLGGDGGNTAPPRPDRTSILLLFNFHSPTNFCVFFTLSILLFETILPTSYKYHFLCSTIINGPFLFPIAKNNTLILQENNDTLKNKPILGIS